LSKTPTPGETAGQRLLADGTHPNQEGQTLMAKTVLLALGVPPGDFPKVEKEWMENPCGKGVKVGKGLYALISRNQFEAVMKRSSKGRASAAQAIISGLWQKALEESGEPADSEKAATYAQGKISSLVDAYIKQNDPVP
jgi:hypothetical protein